MLPVGAAGSLPCPDFDLKGTLLSGQVFRWNELKPVPGTRTVPGTEFGFAGWISGRLTHICQRDGNLFFSGASPETIRRFFSLDVDLPAIARRIDVDPVIHDALRSHWGLRVIRQEPWECLASFILSAFNNIPRLTAMLDRLAARCGPSGGGAPGVASFATPRGPAPAVFPFPRAETFVAVPERALRACGLGYRAPYLKAAAQEVASGRADLRAWACLEDDALRECLLALPGVGEKVVECVMLFAYGRPAAFPVDVWIGRAMRAWYFRKGRFWRSRTVPRVTDRKIREFARAHFGPECGWAQQYLFCHVRRRSK